ncbi:hypothetical protein ABC955_05630 [Citromicrobium bathyomarinum]
MTSTAKRFIIWIFGLIVAVAAFFVDSLEGYVVAGGVAALLIEALVPKGRNESVIGLSFDYARSERERRQKTMLVGALRAIENLTSSEELVGQEYRSEGLHFLLMTIAHLQDLGVIDYDEAERAVLSSLSASDSESKNYLLSRIWMKIIMRVHAIDAREFLDVTCADGSRRGGHALGQDEIDYSDMSV